MKRPNIEEMRANLDSWPEPGLGKDKAIEVFDYILDVEHKLKKLGELWDDLHEQYIVVLDERDALQEVIDELERQYQAGEV